MKSLQGPYELYLIWGYYGTHYRVRLDPPFGGLVFYIRNIILLGSTTKNTTHMSSEVALGSLFKLFLPGALADIPRMWPVAAILCVFSWPADFVGALPFL